MELIATTERLVIRKLTENDAAFILELLNMPSWLQFIGDRNVRTLDDARNYIIDKYLPSYKQKHGLYCVALKDSLVPIGTCGLMQRDNFDHPDIGFAYLPEYEGKGYAKEAALSMLEQAKKFEYNRLLAITTKDNIKSIRLLEKLGFSFEKHTSVPNDDVELMLFSVNF